MHTAAYSSICTQLHGSTAEQSERNPDSDTGAPSACLARSPPLLTRSLVLVSPSLTRQNVCFCNDSPPEMSASEMSAAEMPASEMSAAEMPASELVSLLHLVAFSRAHCNLFNIFETLTRHSLTV